MGITQINDPFRLLERINRYPTVRRFVLALSGGLDSVVLLHGLCQLRPQLSQQLNVVHVHHGLMPDANDWTRHCEAICEALGVCLDVHRVTVDRGTDGLEAAAREARYAVLADYMDPDSALLTAHHRDDQVETVLLHLIKGAGPSGLAGMPAWKNFAGGWHFRPLLDYSREDLHRYAGEFQLNYVEDSSNLDRQFERNYLRHQVIPELKSRWPSAGAGIARAARHQSDVLSIMDRQASTDLANAQIPSGAVDIRKLLGLSRSRQNNVLRYWLRRLGGVDENPSEANLDSVRRELMESSWDSEPQILLGKTRVYRYRNLLFQETDSAVQAEIFQQSFSWRLDQPFMLDALGFYFEPAVVLNRIPALTADDRLTVRFRQGGEKIKLPGSDHHKSLKKLLQTWDVPPWRRQQIPLLYHDKQLIVVWGYAIGTF